MVVNVVGDHCQGLIKCHPAHHFNDGNKLRTWHSLTRVAGAEEVQILSDQPVLFDSSQAHGGDHRGVAA